MNANKLLQFIFIVSCILLTQVIQVSAQNDTVRGTYIPYGQEKPVNRRDTIVQVKKNRDKPGTLLGDFLHYLSPVKYDFKDSVYPLYTEDDPFFIHESNHVIQDLQNRRDSGGSSEQYWSQKNNITNNPGSFKKDTTRVFSKQVYGYHPYWMGTAYKSYNFTLLTRVAYFAYHVNPVTGFPMGLDNWYSSDIIELAHKSDCKVDLCITNFGSKNNEQFLTSIKAQELLTANVIKYLREKNGDGLNINFEGVPKRHSTAFTAFVKLISQKLKSINPQYKITVTIPAIDWRNAYDVASLKDYVDFFFVMGYDFYGKYNKVAGPNSLLFSGANWSTNNIDATINAYLELGAPAEKLLLGLPYYGNEWIVKSGSVPSEVVKYVGARTYSYINSNYADKYVARYDSSSHAIYYVFRDSVNWIQCWTDNEFTLGIKYDYINEKKLGGLGIWALGYDNNFNELWALIKTKFTVPRDTSIDFHTRLKQTLEYSVSQKTISQLNKKSPDFTERFADRLGKSWRVFTLLFAILMLFAVIGFIIAITDYDIRFVLFNQEVRVYMFFILIILLTALILRIINVLQNYDVVLILAIVFGISAALILLNVGGSKKSRADEERP